MTDILITGTGFHLKARSLLINIVLTPVSVTHASYKYEHDYNKD